MPHLSALAIGGSGNVEAFTTTAGPPLDEPFDLTIDLVRDPSDGSAALGIVIDGTNVPDDLYLCHYWPDAVIAGAARITDAGERVLLPIEEFDGKAFCLFRSATERTLGEMNAFGGGPADDLDAWIITAPESDDVLRVALTDDKGAVRDRYKTRARLPVRCWWCSDWCLPSAS